MNCSVSDCKIKWTNLRSSYNRVMRDSETPSGSREGKKRKWYLLEAMQFLRDFTSSHRSSISNEESQDTAQDTTQDQPRILLNRLQR
ncbi:uncharacterized protein [Leptinotarsa decemlineata]|uniref:uncharacterized protein n=1 Tax=Leptinotarsa decemlineata TaxID=7539 RepID=UPI003D30B395